MKKSVLILALGIVLSTISVFICSCDNDDTTYIIYEKDNNAKLTAADKEALLFMLEEEKLARDTYSYLADFWGVQQFPNIESSEQSHMNAIMHLLDMYKIPYTVKPEGEFSNVELQDLYNQFIVDGVISKINAFTIGATIEDLDIVDLRERMDASLNTFVISVFSRLECGSENHLRTFVLGLSLLGEIYTPQYLSQEEYDAIISSVSKPCR